jgi:Fur family peroxide stress response transcriptional regulator
VQIGRVDSREIERRTERFKETARRAGVKLTHQRLEIFREVAGSVEHPSAEAVHRALLSRMPTLSLDTVYRTLWLLRDLNLIATLGQRREVVRFDANLNQHHHYVCARCGLTRDFESAELNALRIPESVADFGSIDSARVEVMGVCSRCAREETEGLDSSDPVNTGGTERSRS